MVRPEAFDLSVPEIHSLRQPGALDDPGHSHLLENLVPAPTVAAELEASLAQLCPDGELVAVRSSAIDEDGANASFAGQLESFLAVRPSEVAAKVAAVWRSGFSARVRAYRLQRGLAAPLSAPAVLVQRLVNADVSGVAFGADPVTGNRNRRVIAAVPGFGLGLVAGETDADTWQIDRAGHVLERHLAAKASAWRLTPDGLRPLPLDPSAATAPSLADDQLAQVAAAVDIAEKHFGVPQDIEWAISEGRLFVLQSRPITTLGTDVPDDLPFSIWDNSNIVESYSGITTPLTFSFAQRAYEGVYRQFCRILAVPARRIEASDTIFKNMLGLHQGRIYYNLLNWYRVLALLPGFAVNRRFMEQMMGVKEPMPPDLVAGLDGANMGERILDGLNLARSACALLVQHFRLPAAIRRFRARLDDALQPPDRPWEAHSAGALVAAFQDLEQRLLRRWDAPLVNDFLTMIFYGTLRDVTARWCGDESGTLHNDLLCDGGGMLSAEPARRITEMARLAAMDAALPRILSTSPRPLVEQSINQHPDLRAARDTYLLKFGDRCFDELKLESPVLTEDPLPLYRAIGRLATLPAPEPDAVGTSAAPSPRAAAEARMAQALDGHPLRRLIFRWVLNHARSGVRERENLRLERTRLFGRVRRIFLALGQRLKEMNVLDDVRDVFFLEVDEMLQFVSGSASSVQLRELAAVRRSEFAAYRLSPPLPYRFSTQGVPSRHLPIRGHSIAESAPTEHNEKHRQGLGCCPGVVRGRVCLVTDPLQSTVRPGEILVAERTDPGWIMLFPAAAGLLVERGSLLSHSAIVARELRLPAVVSVTGLMSWLKDGDFVEFDGSSGIIRKLPTSETDVAPAPLIPSMAPADECIGRTPIPSPQSDA